MKLFGIIGAGGFGREVMPLARAMSLADGGPPSGAKYVFVVEDEQKLLNGMSNGHEIWTLSEFLSASYEEKYFNIAIGDSLVRSRIADSIPYNVASPFTIRAMSHISLDENTVGIGAIFSHFTHVTSNANIGKYFHCNIYSYVAHDCVIGDFVTFAPGVKCNGNVVVEDHVYIGTGAVIKNGAEKPIIIGKGAVVGMGAVVTKNVPPGETVVGNPARPIRPAG